ncbi:hypothetical protein [Hydrogenophaga sp.]|nr:hypothetical protein [Hydrogenophaga sp.]
MPPIEILFADFDPALLVVLAPGPENILAISRGLSQGQLAAELSSGGMDQFIPTPQRRT